ncbi:MAG: hypothetical protein PF518_12655 [Spirochaetaceae bacterium]|jgi:hypothetical protein|nr:hypothetical protein [Spirochaetaceae bacterium]
MMDEIKNEIREEIRKEFQKDWEKEKKRNPHCNSDSWWEERMLGMKIFLGFLMGIGFVGLIFLFGWVVMLLWNWLMPEIFGLKQLSYWQAWGLLILSSILFKSFPSGGSSEGGKRGKHRRRKELRKLMDEEVIRPDNPPVTDGSELND